MKILATLAFLAPLLLAAACASTPDAEQRTCSWVWILTGPSDAKVLGDARAQAFTGHFANMKRLSDEGKLLLAGPFNEPRVRSDHRGVFVLATSDPAEALSIAQTDPAAQAGIFVFQIEPFRTHDALERLPEMHADALKASGVENTEPGFHARPYVLVAGTPATAAEEAFAKSSAPVLFSGRVGTGASERALFCLDAATGPDADAIVDAAGREGIAWVVMPWFATEEVANLRAGE